MAARARQIEVSGRLLVLAPHPDDETLGCGGLILLARRAGMPVLIVFLTDGGASHPGLVPREEMAAVRRREAAEAATRLEVPDFEICGFPDGRLRAHGREVVAAVARAVERFAPSAAFAPLPRDRHADHEAAAAIARAALRRTNSEAALYGYPAWAWQHWPFVRPRYGLRPRPGAALRLAASVTRVADVRGVLEEKRHALAAHQTQLGALPGGRMGHSLEKRRGGTFLECFFTGYEFFAPLEVR
jgi:LmbE family N-acetylglucosaminyl deacetylase